MKGISPKGICPVPNCGKKFTFDAQKGFFCPEHLTEPKKYQVCVRYHGDRIRRETDLDGNPLVTFAQAHALIAQIRKEKKNKTLDPSKWKNSFRIEYEFIRMADRWYTEKERLMESGQRAPSYVPKLKTYINHYYKHFKGQDVREIRTSHIKAFVAVLPNMSPTERKLSLKYQKNIMDALENFFNWLKDEEAVIKEKPKFPSIEVPEHDFKTITPEIQAGILELIPEEHKPIFIFLFNQGCRPSEARALKWDCIEGDVVTYKRTFSGRILHEHTKTKQIRKNLLFPETLMALPSRPVTKGKIVSINDATRNYFVFIHGKQTRRPYSQDLLNKTFNRARELFNEKTREINPEWLDVDISLYEATKHSFGTRHYSEGVPLEVLEKHFGHKKKESTQRYTRVDAVEAFRRMIPLRKQQAIER
jgi:integrase